MIRIYGCSDDLVEIEGSKYHEDEIGCYDSDVRIFFDDGTVIQIGYNKPDLGIWYIIVEKQGTAKQELKICTDENAYIHSDEFFIDSEIVRHRLVKQKPPKKVEVDNG